MAGRGARNPGMFWPPGPRGFIPPPLAGRGYHCGGPRMPITPWGVSGSHPQLGFPARSNHLMQPWGFPPRPFNSEQHLNRGGGQGSRGSCRGNFGGQKRPIHDKNNQQHQNKKKKPNKRDITEFPFFCDTCDKGFKTEEKYEEHSSAHEKCTYDGCPYVAASKLVKLHIQLQHRTGMAKKIWSLESSEDVKKWIEERKRNFPTAANIAAKKAAQKQRAERGEVLETKDIQRLDKKGRFKFKDRKQSNKHLSKSHQNQSNVIGKQSATDQGTAEQDNPISVNVSKLSTHHTTDPEADPLSLLLTQAGSGSDDEAPEDKNPPISLSSGLASLAACYGSSDEEADDVVQSNVVTTPGDVRKSNTKVTGDKDAPIGRETNYLASKNRQLPLRHRKRKKKNNERETKQSVRKPTLLQKLLASEMRHERNVILQCVRYIVKRDFFSAEKA